jgi:ferredoxin/flavodoxin---NADP+ reductase
VVSRESFVHHGRLTTLFDQGRISADLGLDAPDPARDRAMICGSPEVLADFRQILDRRGFMAAPRIGSAGQYVFERAFVER